MNIISEFDNNSQLHNINIRRFKNYIHHLLILDVPIDDILNDMKNNNLIVNYSKTENNYFVQLDNTNNVIIAI